MIDKTKGYMPTNTMRELIRDNSMLLPAISRFDIDFGFGDQPVVRVCEENHVDLNTFICVCNLLSGYPFNSGGISLTTLMSYLKKAHTAFLNVTLPKIRRQLIDGINNSVTNEVSLLLIRFFDDYVGEVKRHMEYENEVIFTYIEKLQSGNIDSDFRIGSYSVDHEPMAEKLNDLKDIFIYHYKHSANPHLSSALFDIIMCERDLMTHFDVENKVLLPLVEKLESNLIVQKDKLVKEAVGDNENESPANLLRDREKEIVKCLALGMSTKEIADKLCISAFTVSTHRRNINSKLGIHSSAALVIFAILNNIVDISDVK